MADPATQPPCLRYSRHMSIAVALLLLTAIGAVQLLDNPFATNFMGAQHVASLWQQGTAEAVEITADELSAQHTADTTHSATAPPSVDEVLTRHPQLAQVCTDAYREAQYEKVAKWGIPPLMQVQ